jgi:flavin-dependent dehydrogenase
MIDADVLILGAGPAGSVAALNLAPTQRVLLAERRIQVSPRIGEALAPVARRLLSEMGLWHAFLEERHVPCYGNRSVWGVGELMETDFLRNPDGHGWHLDRARFDAWLRRVAVVRGAILLTPARLTRIERDGRYWHAQFATDRGPTTVTAAFAIDAGGRAAPLARRLSAKRWASDRLACGWVHGRARSTGCGAGLTTVEAVEDGWWYTAPIPEGQRVLAFMTDADLPAARLAHSWERLVERAAETSEINRILAESEFVFASGGFTAAHSSTLDPCIGTGWIATGDATMTFDPLSSQGLLHALFTGLAAAEAADSYLSDDSGALDHYQQLMFGVQRAYRRHLTSWYASEARWPSAPFWRRRIATSEGYPARTGQTAMHGASLAYGTGARKPSWPALPRTTLGG